MALVYVHTQLSRPNPDKAGEARQSWCADRVRAIYTPNFLGLALEPAEARQSWCAPKQENQPPNFLGLALEPAEARQSWYATKEEIQPLFPMGLGCCNQECRQGTWDLHA